MRILFIIFFISFSGITLSQEKFLELTVLAKDGEKSLKNFDIYVSCEDDVNFVLISKKKQITFYLSAGLAYKVIVTKKGFYQSIYEIDLTSVHEAISQDGFLAHELICELVPLSVSQPTTINRYFYESRHGKLKTK